MSKIETKTFQCNYTLNTGTIEEPVYISKKYRKHLWLPSQENVCARCGVFKYRKFVTNHI